MVPNPLGMQGLMGRPTTGPESKPPMTSKQAQKLYREATRGPRLSRAEQRRVEREEQDRIRRELDRDRQTTRARALRDRKKEKEQRVLEDKRRKGLPLVEPRASQDTISRVGLVAVREEEEVDENIPPGQAAGTTGEVKRRRLGDGAEEAKKNTAVKVEVKEVRTPAKGVEDLGAKGALEDGQASTSGGSASLGERVGKGVTGGDNGKDPAPKKKLLETPKLEEMKGPTEENAHGRKTSADGSKLSSGPSQPGPPKATDESLAAKTCTKPPTARPSRLGTPNQSAPCPEKAKIKTTPDPPPNTTPINKPGQTQNLQPHAARPPQQQRPPKPAPAQPPSARKEARELQGDPPAAVQPAKPTPRQQPCMADFKSDRPRQITRQVARVRTPMAPPPRPTKAEPAKAMNPSEALALPFISTQDLLFSSQDLRDVEEPTTTPGKAGDPRSSNKLPPFRRPPVAGQGSSRLSNYAPLTPAQPHTTPRPRPKPPTPGLKQPPPPVNGDKLRQPGFTAEQQVWNIPLSGQPRSKGHTTHRCPTTPSPCERSPGSSVPVQRFEVMVALNRSKKTHQEEGEKAPERARTTCRHPARNGPWLNPQSRFLHGDRLRADPELDLDRLFDDLVTATS
ncbi:hypothetical protein CHGG_05387 [Chaetomium globosum CBS 148.51]|uniref:Uncharacterized protein n=1 Tax=Chaetomium globosum (strain ATCC 6205 / CBS 148.51 / DSM 1962 / NBRC 6347 / NRRL 1970) TaxID=306901 RepID=Q2H7H8_CHAGB|nr:uncharacterized protein CHGG_05387 [Chaetomium globosum CBS 148.51]EAQ88768.1 hypothetical protein CHGG_05387 [Chaetomium globosum CBS 148.51]